MKRCLAAMLSLLLVTALLPLHLHTASAETSGQCGENLYWSFDEETGTLTITGSGEMYNGQHWSDISSQVLTVLLPDGLTNIGNDAFYECTGLTEITIPDSVTNIDYRAFHNCTDLTDVYYLGTEEQKAEITINDGNDSLLNATWHCLDTVFAHTDYDLTINDPDTGERAVRKAETNLGDFCADALRTMFNADIAFDEGGVIRKSIAEGDITYQQVFNVHPFGNTAVLAEVTGQQILDALEHGAASNPDEKVSFLQVAGLKFEIHNYLPANETINEYNMWVSNAGLDEYRVKNVQVLNKDSDEYEPLDLEKTYTLAGDNYMLIDMGNGFGMFGENITILKDSGIKDNRVLIDYIHSMPEVDGIHQIEGYTDPRGEGRITIVSEAPVEPMHGQCGDNLYWSFDETTGTLTITGSGAMYDFDDLEEFPWDNIRSEINDVVFSDEITSIGAYAFFMCTELTEITIPDSVVAIGKYAFRGCTKLEAVDLGSGVTVIGMQAFDECGITTLTIPDSVTTIGDDAFAHCTCLKTVSLGQGVASIGTYAFGGCTVLETLEVSSDNTAFCTVDGVLLSKDMTTLIKYPCAKTNANYAIPDGVSKVNDDAFNNCIYLSSITIPPSVTSFQPPMDCQALTEILADSQSNRYATVDGVLFSKDHTVLLSYPMGRPRTSYDIPDGVETIGWSSFRSCQYLEQVTIPASVTSIGDFAFENCEALSSVTIPASVTSIGIAAFKNCEALSSVTISDGVTSIGSLAFSYCTGLTTIVIPASVTSIDYLTFDSCTGLTEITIPDSVTSIGHGAFYDCAGLTDVYYLGTEEQKTEITIEDENHSVLNATWHYLNAQVVSKSLTLEGKIQINFYVNVSDDALADEESYALITFNDVTTKQLVKDAPISEKDGVVRRQFTQDVIAKQMHDKVTIELFDGSDRRLALFDSDGTEVEGGLMYSASDYVQAALASTLGDELKTLMNACENYGVAAQIQFSYEANGLTLPAEVVGIAADALSQYEAAYDGTLPEGITKVTSSLLIQADNTVRQYFYLEDGKTANDYTFTVDTATVTPTDAGNGKYYLEITNIPAKRLDEMHVFTVSDGTDTYTIEYCALSYAFKALSYDDTFAPVNLKNLARAMYLYNQAADNYFGNN